MTKLIGFFGGTFDPIHFGHLNLAVELFEKHRLSKVLFCPAKLSPFKQDTLPHASDADRLAMLKLALQDFPHFEITTLELDREAPSYTIDSIRHLVERGGEYRLLLSEEVAATLESWKEPEELLRLAPPLIGPRGKTIPLRGPFKHILEKGLTQTRVLDISSTEIKERLQKKLTCAHLVPRKVLDYIQNLQLYSSAL